MGSPIGRRQVRNVEEAAAPVRCGMARPVRTGDGTEARTGAALGVEAPAPQASLLTPVTRMGFSVRGRAPSLQVGRLTTLAEGGSRDGW